MTEGDPATGDLTPTLRTDPLWTDQQVRDAGIPIVDVPVVTIGGGFGSFVLADVLRIAGLPPDAMRVLTLLDRPYDRYRFLAACSQIPDHERLRSDSASCPDNIWGFPSYAVREAWEDRTLRPIAGVATEPIFSEYFTPRAEQVYRSVDREAARIGWADMAVTGRVSLVRQRHGGGYFSILTPPAGRTATKRVAYRSSYVHVAVGYPGVQFLPDLQAYRQMHNDFRRVVNAYEPHDHVYETLLGRGGDVLVRGSGIVASRVFQRLLDDVERKGATTRIWHLFRTYVADDQGPRRFRREGANGFAYQAFNYPKAAWGGQLREDLLELHGEARAELIKRMGGTNTPKRTDWVRQLDRNRDDGTYRAAIGEVIEVVPSGDGRIMTKVADPHGRHFDITTDFVVDATGLDGNVHDSGLLDDLITVTGAATNPLGRLEVSPAFEVVGTRSSPGRLYASGSMTLGGPYAPVDSFLGLQYAALEIAEDLARQGVLRHIGPWRSLRQWLRWMRGVAP